MHFGQTKKKKKKKTKKTKKSKWHKSISGAILHITTLQPAHNLAGDGSVLFVFDVEPNNGKLIIGWSFKSHHSTHLAK